MIFKSYSTICCTELHLLHEMTSRKGRNNVVRLEAQAADGTMLFDAFNSFTIDGARGYTARVGTRNSSLNLSEKSCKSSASKIKIHFNVFCVITSIYFAIKTPFYFGAVYALSRICVFQLLPIVKTQQINIPSRPNSIHVMTCPMYFSFIFSVSREGIRLHKQYELLNVRPVPGPIVN